MIVALEEAKYNLNEMRGKVKELGSALRIDETREKAAELEKQTYAEDFWNDQENSSKILQQVKQLKDRVEEYEKLAHKLEDAITLAEMAIEENDESYTEEVQHELAEIQKTEERMRLELLLSGEYDDSNAILSFHPGAGGTEAQDWALMLYRMYTRWGEKHGYDVKLIDWLDGEEAGIKSATIMISGPHAYGYLKSENGVHRLVRVSPFDASGRRHTSFASVEVMPEFKDDGKVEIAVAVTAGADPPEGGWLEGVGTPILTVKNRSKRLTQVKAEKSWDNTDEADRLPVTVELWRNGAKMVGDIYTQTLSEENDWNYIWYDLPLFVDGDYGRYTLREVRIGDVIAVKRMPVVYQYKVLNLVTSRQPAKNVPAYCLNITPQEELDKLDAPRETIFVFRDRGTGRPTKKERRELDSLMDNMLYEEE